jgi:hypothetical protein
MMGCTIMPVNGAASQNHDRCSTSAPKIPRMREAFPFCKAKPNWIPKKPKLMFQICQNDKRGLERTAVGCITVGSND